MAGAYRRNLYLYELLRFGTGGSLGVHDCTQSVPVCVVFDLLCKGTVEPVPEGTGSVRIDGMFYESIAGN